MTAFQLDNRYDDVNTENEDEDEVKNEEFEEFKNFLRKQDEDEDEEDDEKNEITEDKMRRLLYMSYSEILSAARNSFRVFKSQHCINSKDQRLYTYKSR